MSLVAIDWNPDVRKLASFGWAASAILVTLGVAGFVRSDGSAVTASVALGVALLGAVLSRFRPTALRPLWVGLSLVGLPIGFVVSYVVLGFLFFGIFTPIGIAFRIVGRDMMGRRFEPGAATYWTPRQVVTDPSRYLSQF